MEVYAGILTTYLQRTNSRTFVQYGVVLWAGIVRQYLPAPGIMCLYECGINTPIAGEMMQSTRPVNLVRYLSFPRKLNGNSTNPMHAFWDALEGGIPMNLTYLGWVDPFSLPVKCSFHQPKQYHLALLLGDNNNKKNFTRLAQLLKKNNSNIHKYGMV